MRTFFKFILGLIGLAILLAVVAFIALNLYVHTTYNKFYQDASRQFPIPGINEGFIPQDLDYLEEESTWLISGYMTENGASPVYTYNTRSQKSGRFFVELKDGTMYKGHGSAITSDDTYAFLACDGGFLVLDLQMIYKSHDGDKIVALDKVELDVSPSFMNIENNTLYAGEFYYPGEYETDTSHHLTTPDGTKNKALMFRYPKDITAPYGFSNQAEAVYSIPDMVQGMTTIYDHTIVLSQSWGINPSYLRSYDMQDVEPDGTFALADGRELPLYSLDSKLQVSSMELPPMLEGIESVNNRVYTSEESASNKYIFGKLYGAGNVYSLNLPQKSKSSSNK